MILGLVRLNYGSRVNEYTVSRSRRVPNWNGITHMAMKPSDIWGMIVITVMLGMYLWVSAH